MRDRRDLKINPLSQTLAHKVFQQSDIALAKCTIRWRFYNCILTKANFGTVLLSIIGQEESNGRERLCAVERNKFIRPRAGDTLKDRSRMIYAGAKSWANNSVDLHRNGGMLRSNQSCKTVRSSTVKWPNRGQIAFPLWRDTFSTETYEVIKLYSVNGWHHCCGRSTRSNTN